MRVLVVGSNGRAHALAWALGRSPRVSEVLVAPGNGGTERLPNTRNLRVPATALDVLVEAALRERARLTVIGPEAPLVAGIVDRFAATRLAAFGPTAAAARLEGSKAFAKEFMRRHGIPTAASATFSELEPALEHLHRLDAVPVVKASGLAAGKGVVIPDSLPEAEAAVRAILGPEQRFGEAGQEIVIEERLRGPEVSLLAFCDGRDVAVMPAARDHKRLLEGDNGPNTAGMGSYVPSPDVTPELVQQTVESVFKPALGGMAAEGSPYVGVLYAGLILSPAGLRVLEFNCRFGDPEAEAILPLLESDLVDVIEACLHGNLAENLPVWSNRAAATVVMAAEGYPDRPRRGDHIEGVAAAQAAGCLVFHGGTKHDGQGQLRTSGGRALAVTAVADDLTDAVETAYRGVSKIRFSGRQYRRDIGRRVSAYTTSGVELDATNRAVTEMTAAVRSTYTPRVLSDVGAFGGLFDIAGFEGHPVLAASTDGVGSKVKLAAEWARYEGIGHDLVNHCVNDIVVQGAKPLFFLDYVAQSRLDPDAVVQVVSGIAEACRATGCALIGGEAAEVPGVYAPETLDVAGTIVGVVDRERILPRRAAMRVGDVLIGLPSSGFHTNGYSLIRRLVSGRCDEGMVAELLVPHRSYLHDVDAWTAADVAVHALCHLTRGAWIDNLPRVLPPHLAARIDVEGWEPPELMRRLVAWGGLDQGEAYRTFNMGVGMVAVVPPDAVEAACKAVEVAFVVGELVPADPDQPRVELA